MGVTDFDFGRLFCIRLAGVPFDVLEELATPGAARLARDVIALEQELERDVEAVRADASTLDLDRPVVRRVRQALKSRSPIPLGLPARPPFARYDAHVAELDRLTRELDSALADEQAQATRRLWLRAIEVLPDFLVFESESAWEELNRRASASDPGHDARERLAQRAFALYLQRVCAKNETISRFGPVVWGRVEASSPPFALRATPGVSRRTVEVERWVVAAIAAAATQDPEAREEIRPRVHPSGRLDGEQFVREDSGVEISLTPEQRDIVERCDGETPAHRLAATAELEPLVSAGVLLWELELPAWDGSPIHTLLREVNGWRDLDARRRWSAPIVELIAIADAYAVEQAPGTRKRMATRVRALVEEIGGSAPAGRTLYQASNPLIEECTREVDVTLGQDMVDRLMVDLAPWLNLYRDTFCLAASIAFTQVRELYASAPRRDGRVSLAALFAHGKERGVDLSEDAYAKWGAQAFDQVKQRLRSVVEGRPDAPEWVLRGEDLVLFPDRTFPLFDESSSPSPDLLLAASSVDAVARGEYRWVVGELHQLVVLLQRALEWCCPDRDALADSFREFAGGQPWFLGPRNRRYHAPVHISSAMMDVIPGGSFVGVERCDPAWHAVPPSQTEVVVCEADMDVRVRHAASGRDLGSLLRAVWLFQGFHPFYPLELGAHTPRLCVGKIVVQRRTWRVTAGEVGAGKLTGVSGEHVVHVARLRAARDLPRWVYVRPTRAAIGRFELIGLQNRDIKPVYVDLESYTFIDIFLRRLHQYGELEVVEMLPTPEQMVWREADGRYFFELRAATPRRERDHETPP